MKEKFVFSKKSQIKKAFNSKRAIFSFLNMYSIYLFKNEAIFRNAVSHNYNYNFTIQAFDNNRNNSAKSELVSATPSSTNIISLANTSAKIIREKLKANISIFSKRLFSQGAVPYLVMFSVIIINVLIYHGVKREIQKKVDKNINKSLNEDITPHRKSMVEVKKTKRKVLKF